MKVVTTIAPVRGPSPYLDVKENKNIRIHHAQRKIALPTMEGLQFEKVTQILYMEANGNYTILYFYDGRKAIVCKTLRDMEMMVNNARQFVRIHRSSTINLNHIQKYVKGKNSHVVMEGGASLAVSNGRKSDFLLALELYFG